MEADGKCYNYPKRPGQKAGHCINWHGVNGKCMFRGEPGKLVSRMKRCPIDYECMTAQIPKGGVSKLTKSTTPKCGNQKSGKPQKQNSLLLIHNVAVVEVAVKYPIILTSKSTENLSTSTYGIHNHIATTVIPVSIAENLSVQSVEKLWQSQRVNDALRALKIAISSELNPDGNDETNPETPPTEKRTGHVIRAKK